MSNPTFEFPQVVSPREEMVAYEILWGMQGQTEKRLAELFARNPGTPSELLRRVKAGSLFGDEDIERLRDRVKSRIPTLRFSVSLHGLAQYPETLRASDHPVELFYFRGDIGLASAPSVSIVGSRKASPEGIQDARVLARLMVAHRLVVVSGLAKGVDTAAMTEAIAAGGRVVGVIGTPIDKVYPAENAALQERVAREHLLVSQVPFYRHSVEPFRAHRVHFPQRNVTMASLSLATVIVEASDTSGTLTQARAVLKQGKPLFIMRRCLSVPGVTWPKKYIDNGAVVVEDPADAARRVEAIVE